MFGWYAGILRVAAFGPRSAAELRRWTRAGLDYRGAEAGKNCEISSSPRGILEITNPVLQFR